MALYKKSVSLQRSSTIHKELDSFKILFFIFFIVLALFIYLVLSLLMVKTKKPQKTTNNTNISISNTPNSTENNKSIIKEQIIWMVLKDGYNNSNFWFEIPYPGPFCDACLDFSAGVTDLQSLSLIGGLFDAKERNGWIFNSTIIKDNIAKNQKISEIPIDIIYKDLVVIPIGKNKIYNLFNNRQVEITHRHDKEVNNIKLYIADLKSSDSKYTEQIAVFKHNGNLVYLSFINEGKNLYSDVFNHIIDTFSFKKMEGTKYIDLCKKYSAYPIDICADY